MKSQTRQSDVRIADFSADVGESSLWQIRQHREKSAIPKTRFNWRVSDFIRGMMVRWFELRARITGRAYYCSTLAGQEDYNLTVNSDLTVSCCCQDYDGSGDIPAICVKTRLRKFISGRWPSGFATNWRRGKFQFPPVCVAPSGACPEKTAPPKPQLPYRGMLLENTVLCNVDCIGCAREGAAAIRS